VKFAKENNNRVRWLTADEEVRLFTVLPARYHSLVVALHTGLRKSEQLNLEWIDIDFNQGFITVRESKPGESRIMNRIVAETLNRLPRAINNVHVFVGKEPGTRRTDLAEYWEEYLKKSGIENFHWHDLRHTFASRLASSGASWMGFSVSKWTASFR
jgi:integrase